MRYLDLIRNNKECKNEKFDILEKKIDLCFWGWLCFSSVVAIIILIALPFVATENHILFNLKHIRYHDLRHSCASLLLANGVSLKEIQDWLGHSDFSTTANIYSHLEYGAKVKSANKIAENLSLEEKTKDG